MPRYDSAPIAVVGLGAIFPGRGDTPGFWRDIVEGVDTLRDVPSTHWLLDDYYDDDPSTPDRTYGRRGGFISPQAFEPAALGVPPATLEATDTSQLLALLAAQKILADIENATGGKLDRARTSVVLGVASATELTAHMAGRLQRPAWIKAMREAGLDEARVQDIADKISSNFTEWSEATFPGLLGNVVAGRIANRFDLGGSNYVTDAACASSLSAVQVALHELRSGDSDTVLAGGVDTLNDILMYMCFSKTPALSPTGDCRPFSDTADGTMLGEGVGLLALRRLEDAERDGDRIHALICGLGGGSDGKGGAIYAPQSSGQARTLRRAYEKAGYGAASVELVEAHGTGTTAGDAAELAGLHQVFDPDGEARRRWCALGSIKSQIGHTKAAAGAASLIKAVMALSQKVLPPTIKVEQPAIGLAGPSPFYVNTTARPWIRGGDHPRRASVSAFGFGGSNFHVTLEEYDGPCAAPRMRMLSAELVLLSAPTKALLVSALEAAAAGVSTRDDLARSADASHRAFDAHAGFRLSIVAASAGDFDSKAATMASQLRDGRAGKAPAPRGVSYGAGASIGGETAFLFPGQGSQYVGMGRDLALTFPRARAVWDAAADHRELHGVRLHDLAFPPRAFTTDEGAAQTAKLTKMENAQPALAAASLACLALLDQIGLKADCTAGHSFGEVMALHAAGVFNGQDALTVARARGLSMMRAAGATPGAMLAVQANAEDVAAHLADDAVVLANDNAPTQVALSGPTAAIDAIEARLGAASMKTRRLPVASAFHSQIVAGAVAPFANALAGISISNPRIPVFANASAEPYGHTAETIRAQLSEQIASPVKFRAMVEAMYDHGVRTFMEVGAGDVVSTLTRQTLAGRDATVVSLDHARWDGLAAFLSGLGALATAGRVFNVAALFADMPAPEKPVERSRYAVEISGANYKKPYPPPGGAAALLRPNMHDAHALQPTRENPPVPDKTQTPDAIARDSLSREIAARHSEFMTLTTQAHSAFLNVMAGLAGTAPAPEAPRPTPIAAEPQIAVATPPPAAPVEPPAPIAAPAQPVVAPTDGVAVVTAIVSDKTGYPPDMLDPQMDLEGELGVDSIKQVEILSAVRERFTDLPEIGPERLVELRTIGLIAGYINGASTNGSQDAFDAPTPAQTNGSTPATNGAADPDMATTIRALVAEKTGYPEEMLEDDMDLEGELGVDSIKQVEILAALRESMPSLPDIEPGELAELRTIRKIADFFG